jgi:DNA-binding LytR/AlgR family response regulator
MSKRILIVDDEALSRQRIRTFLEKENASTPTYEIKEAQDGVEAINIAKEFKPHIILLDIEMPELSGFDVLRHLGSRENCQIIFQTAYDQFALKAFEVNACDYILKPFSDERLRESLQRAAKPLDSLEKYLSEKKSYLNKFVVKAGAKNRIITEDQVLCFTSEEHVTRIVLADIDYAYDYSLSHLEERLDPAKFLRIHRNSLIKLSAITQFTDGAEVIVTLTNGLKLKASREGGRALKRSH